jgi:hypothetical protein
MGVVQRNASKENLPYLCNLFLNTPPPALSGGDWATAAVGEEERGNLLMALGNCCTHNSRLLENIFSYYE